MQRVSREHTVESIIFIVLKIHNDIVDKNNVRQAMNQYMFDENNEIVQYYMEGHEVYHSAGIRENKLHIDCESHPINSLYIQRLEID